MTWPDVAALAVVFLGMALIFWVSSQMSASLTYKVRSEDPETPIQKMTRRFAVRSSLPGITRRFADRSFLPGMTWKVTTTTTTHTTTNTAPNQKPDPNPKPLVTPPPSDDRPN